MSRSSFQTERTQQQQQKRGYLKKQFELQLIKFVRNDKENEKEYKKT